MFVKKDKYFYTGFFVIIAIALLVIFLLLSGFFSFIVRSSYVETYFSSSIQGLTTGSPVKFHGVTVGHVKAIKFTNNVYPSIKEHSNYMDKFDYIYVLIAIDSKEIENTHERQDFKNIIPILVRRGLRCTIVPSGLTGDSYIALDFYPKQKRQKLAISWTPKYPYIPSLPSTLEYFSDSIKGVISQFQQINFVQLDKNINTMAKQISHTSENVNQFVDQLKANPSQLFWRAPPKPIYQRK